MPNSIVRNPKICCIYNKTLNCNCIEEGECPSDCYPLFVYPKFMAPTLTSSVKYISWSCWADWRCCELLSWIRWLYGWLSCNDLSSWHVMIGRWNGLLIRQLWALFLLSVFSVTINNSQHDYNVWFSDFNQ